MRIPAVETRASNAGQWVWSLLFFGVFFVAFLFALFGPKAGWIPALVTGVLCAFALKWVISVACDASGLARFGDAWLDLDGSAAPGRPLRATVHYDKGVGGLSRLMVTLECWTCDWRGVKQERLHFARAVAAVTRVGHAAQASIQLDVPVHAPASRTPPALRAEPDRSFAGTPLRKDERFTLWELTVASGTREHVGVGRRFFVPVGEEDASARVRAVVDGDAPARPARRPSLLPIAALVVANLVPLAGVLQFGWQVRDVVMLYWMENLIIGAYNVLRILTLKGERFDALQDKGAGPGPAVPRLGYALFFAVHYGGFCAGHGTFLLMFFFDKPAFGFVPPVLETLGGYLRDPAIVIALLAMIASHGVSFVRHHIVGGERERLEVGTLFLRPYGRVVVTHVVVLAGGMLIMGARQPLGFLLLLVALKTILDLSSHWWEHTGARSGRAASASSS